MVRFDPAGTITARGNEIGSYFAEILGKCGLCGSLWYNERGEYAIAHTQYGYKVYDAPFMQAYFDNRLFAA